MIIQDYLKTHSLEQLHEDYKIDYKFHPDYPNLVQLTYSMIDSPMSEPIVQECRGLILDKNTLEVVSIAFNKFFNYGESNAAKIDWSSVLVQEKLDGSCMTIYYYDNKWHVMTNGSPNAAGNVGDNNFTFAEHFWETFNKQGCILPTNTNLCYIFELTGPYNKIIVQNLIPKLTLLAIRNKIDYKFIHRNYIEFHCQALNVKQVECFDLNTIEDLINSFEHISPLSQEGYVIVDKFDQRIKVKHPQYVKLHHAKDSFSDRAFIELIRMGEIDEMTAYFPEIKNRIEEIKSKYEAYIFKNEVEYNEIKHIDNMKEFASYAVLKTCSGALFAVKRNKVSSIREYMQKLQVDNLLEQLKLK